MTRLRAGRRLAPAVVGVSLLAAALMTAALFPTFVSQACSGCSALDVSGLPSAAFRDSTDAWATVWIAGVLVSTALLFLAGVSSRLLALANAVAAVAGLGLAIFEGAVAFPRVLSAAELVPGAPVSYVLGSGYYLLLIGGVVAVGAAGLMLLIGVDAEMELAPKAPARAWVTPVAGWACLASLMVAVAGAFLPFAGLNCGFGCPPIEPPSVTFSGAVAGSLDGKIVLALLVAAVIAALLRVAGVRNRQASATAFLLALVLTVLISVESLNASTRILGWPYPIPTSPELGDYLLQFGAAIAAVLALVLVSADRPSSRFGRRRGVSAEGVAHPA